MTVAGGSPSVEIGGDVDVLDLRSIRVGQALFEAIRPCRRFYFRGISAKP